MSSLFWNNQHILILFAYNIMNAIRKVVCGISGGVDSAVCALLLKRKGFNVHGVFMQNWDLVNETGCTTEADKEDAAYVCHHLDIPFHQVNFVKEYWTNVFCDVIEQYEAGITPNPDVLCNREIKFGCFFDHVMTTMGADAVATGHYARNSWGQFLENSGQGNGAKLLRSVDQNKDQTLFLSQIHQRALQKTMFPIGAITKPIVKEMAMEAGLERIVRKKESTGICFIGNRNFQSFIDEYIEPKPGNFIDLDTGQIVGCHKGIHNWTIGQKTHIGGLNVAYYVSSKTSDSTDILVVKGTRHPALFTQHFVAKSPSWINSVPEELLTGRSVPFGFRFQHPHPLRPCSVRLTDEQELEIQTDEPIRALANGQYAVLYRDQECLGSAQITRTGPTLYELDAQKSREHTSGFS